MKGCRIIDEEVPEEMEKIKNIMIQVPKDKQLQTRSEIFKALSDPTRLKILYLLSKGELCVCEIIMALDKPQSTISHHLNVLKNSGLIQGRKEGVWIHYSLSHTQLVDIMEKMERITETI